MGKSDLREITKLVTFEITNQLVMPLASYEKVIAIGDEGWNVALVSLWLQNASAVTTNARRISAFIVLTEDQSDAYSQTTDYGVTAIRAYGGMLYYIPHYKYAGFSYAVDSKLSEQRYDKTAARIRIESGKIDGSDVKITFYNPTGSNGYIYVRGVVRLIKQVVL
jgi:hypothetical protein